VTLAELRQTLDDALGGGSVGVPVAARIHCQLDDPQCDLLAGLASLLALAEGALSPERAARLFARHSDDPRQLSVLVSYSSGQTSFVTIGCGAAAEPALHLLLVGNRGVVRLEGAEQFDPAGGPPTRGDDLKRWRRPVERSLRDGASIEV